MPGRHPELNGGVNTSLPLAAKIFAEVHSDTSPRSLSRIASSKPRDCAPSSHVRFIDQERIFVPANWQAAWRASLIYERRTPLPHFFISQVNAIRSLSRSCGICHTPP